MKVLDTSFLIDYESGVPETKSYLLANSDNVFAVPSVILLEFLLGDVHGSTPTDLITTRELVAWVDVYPVTEETVMHAARVAEEIGPQGPNLAPPDAIVAGTARELDAPAVASDSDLTHEATQTVLAVEEYR